jgi:uncharacterized membrane protein (DUF485 family)
LTLAARLGYTGESQTQSNPGGFRMATSTRTTRIGLSLFAVYLAIYGGFVLLAAFWPQAMESRPLAGVNLAIWYGFGLIVAAIFLALVYGWACRTDAARSGELSETGGSEL